MIYKYVRPFGSGYATFEERRVQKKDLELVCKAQIELERGADPDAVYDKYEDMIWNSQTGALYPSWRWWGLSLLWHTCRLANKAA